MRVVMDEQPLFPSTVPALGGARRLARAANCFDVAVLDMALAETSGLDLLPDLYGRDGHPVPVVVFPAQDTPEIAVRMLAVLTKSRASIGNLVATLRKLVGNRRTLLSSAAPIDAPAKKEEFA